MISFIILRKRPTSHDERYEKGEEVKVLGEEMNFNWYNGTKEIMYLVIDECVDVLAAAFGDACRSYGK